MNERTFEVSVFDNKIYLLRVVECDAKAGLSYVYLRSSGDMETEGMRIRITNSNRDFYKDVYTIFKSD